MADAALAATAQNAAPAAPAGGGHNRWHDGGSISFKDLLDIVNPLQHIPIIGSIYRWVTGDEPSDGARVIGDALYGGPIGLVASAVISTVTEDSSGHDLGEQVLASLFGPGNEGSDSPTVAEPTVVASAAALAPAEGAGAAPVAAAATPALQLAIPDHPPIPLFRGAQGPAAPASQPAAPAQDPAAQAFLAQTAQLQRQVANGRSAGTTPVSNHVIPLELTGNPLPARSLQLPTGKSALAATPAAAAPGKVPVSTPDITQKILEALDKYKKLRQQQDDAAGISGSSVDLAF